MFAARAGRQLHTHRDTPWGSPLIAFAPSLWDYCYSSLNTARLLKNQNSHRKKKTQQPQITGYNVLKSRLIIKGFSSPSAAHSRLFCLGTGKWTKFSKFLHVLACVWLPESVPHHPSTVFLEVVSSCQAETGNAAFGGISTICQARESSRGPGPGGVRVKRRRMVSRDFNWEKFPPPAALALPPFPHVTNGKLQRMRTRLLQGQQLNHCRAR